MSTHGRRLLARVPPLGGGARRRARGWPTPASTILLRQAVLRPGTVAPGALLAAALPPGATPNEDVVTIMSALHGDRWPDRDLWICAVRLDTGARVVFGRQREAPSASVGQAVAASCAIPGYYEPTVVSGVRHVDGGVRSLCNLDVVAGAGLDLLVVSAPRSTSGWLPRARDGAWRIPARTQLEPEAAKVRRRGTKVVLLHPDEPARRAMRGATMDPRSRPAIARTVRASVLDGLGARDTRLLAPLRTA
jgi:NTE family protein